MEPADIIRAREEEVAREWGWLQDAINLVAAARAGESDAEAVRQLQHQAMDIGHRRVQLVQELDTVVGRGSGTRQKIEKLARLRPFNEFAKH